MPHSPGIRTLCRVQQPVTFAPVGALTMRAAGVCARGRQLEGLIWLRHHAGAGRNQIGVHRWIPAPGAAAVAGEWVRPEGGNLIITHAGNQEHAVRVQGPLGCYHIVLGVDPGDGC